MTHIKIRPLILSTFLSLSLHGALAALFMPSFFKVSPQEPASFQVAWLMPSPSCHPPTSEDPEDPLQKAPIVVRTSSPSLKNQAHFTSSKPLDPRLRGDATAGKKPPAGPKFSRSQNNVQLKTAQPHHPLPSYPWVCRKRGQEGVVYLHVKTNKEGQVVEVHLHKSSGHDLLDKAALEAVKSWVLSEGNSDKTLSIAFRLEGEAVSFS
jgi:periplasmic protein TonB